LNHRLHYLLSILIVMGGVMWKNAISTARCPATRTRMVMAKRKVLEEIPTL
jgi:hypothetical protein